jgi:calcineurin-like phosphoesterase family protein
MATIWIISDTHFGHHNMACVFTRPDGTPIRPFVSAEEMDETIIANWNAVVRPSDHIWHLGDVAMSQSAMHKVMPRLVGHKRLVRGNHDIFKTATYLKAGFEEIRGCSVIAGLIFTHIPIHDRCLGRFGANVHGHTHEQADFSPRHLNVCVEHTDYRPITLEEVKARVAAKQLAEVAV